MVSLIPLNEVIQIFSAKSPGVLLAVLYSPSRIKNRVELTEPQRILQVCMIPLEKDVQVPPHRHNQIERSTIGTTECWVVMDGSIQLDIYDLDNNLLDSWILSSGSIVITCEGGHGLTSLEANTVIYEFKNGPFFGSTFDKLHI